MGKASGFPAVSATYRVRDAYGTSKLEAEELVRYSGLPYTILRPAMVYGPGDRLHFQKLIDLIRCAPRVLPVIGSGRQRLQPVFIDDVTAGVELARQHPAQAARPTACPGRAW